MSLILFQFILHVDIYYCLVSCEHQFTWEKKGLHTAMCAETISVLVLHALQAYNVAQYFNYIPRGCNSASQMVKLLDDILPKRLNSSPEELF